MSRLPAKPRTSNGSIQRKLEICQIAPGVPPVAENVVNACMNMCPDGQAICQTGMD